MLFSRFLLVIHFTDSAVYMSTPTLPSILIIPNPSQTSKFTHWNLKGSFTDSKVTSLCLQPINASNEATSVVS